METGPQPVPRFRKRYPSISPVWAVVPFAGRCDDALAAYLADRGPTPGPLFVAARYARLHASVRLRPNGLKQLLRRLGRAAGVPRVHAHRFRHTFATWAIAHDAREFDVQHLLGHRSPDMVRRYSATYGSAQAAERHAAFSPGDGMLAHLPEAARPAAGQLGDRPLTGGALGRGAGARRA